MRSEHIQLAWLQGVITIIGAAVAYAAAMPLAAKSVAFGGLVALSGTLLLAWRYASGVRHEKFGAESILRHAYRTELERFMWVALMLAVGFKLLKLAPFWMLMGFIVGQLAWLATPIWTRLNK